MNFSEIEIIAREKPSNDIFEVTNMFGDSDIFSLFEDKEPVEVQERTEEEPLEVKERTEGNPLEITKVKTEETDLPNVKVDVKILSESEKGRKKRKKYRKHKKQEEQLKQKNTEENPLEVETPEAERITAEPIKSDKPLGKTVKVEEITKEQPPEGKKGSRRKPHQKPSSGFQAPAQVHSQTGIKLIPNLFMMGLLYSVCAHN